MSHHQFNDVYSYLGDQSKYFVHSPKIVPGFTLGQVLKLSAKYEPCHERKFCTERWRRTYFN